MKQCITQEQLDELSIEAKERLWKWYRTIYPRSEEKYDRQGFTYIHMDEDQLKKIGLSPSLFSIGQMIEFLDEHCGENYTAWSSDRQCRTRDIMPIGNFGGLEIVLDPNTVICDALWEAVKEVLQDEKKT